jgi:hypothetical protein
MGNAGAQLRRGVLVLAASATACGAASTATAISSTPCQPKHASPSSSAWHIGESHVQPCAAYRGYLDAGGRLWSLPGDQPIPKSDLGNCLTDGEVTVVPRGKNSFSLEYIGPAGPSGTVNVPLRQISPGSTPNPFAALPTPYGQPYGTGSFALECSRSAPTGAIAFNGAFLIPADGFSFPAGDPPDCRRFATLQLVDQGSVRLTTPSGETVDLVPLRQPLLLGCG